MFSEKKICTHLKLCFAEGEGDSYKCALQGFLIRFQYNYKVKIYIYGNKVFKFFNFKVN